MSTAREPTARDPFAPSAAATSATASAPAAGVPTTGAHRAESASLGDLVGEVTRDLSTLVRQEVALAKAEAAQSAKRAGKGAGMFGGAGVAGHMVLLFLSLALWSALGTVLGGGWSALIVAAVWGIVAAVLALRGRKELQEMQGLPQTAESVKKIPDALRPHPDAAPGAVREKRTS